MKKICNKYNIMLIFIIILQIFNIVFWGTQKEGYHIDEIFSYGLANAYYDPFPYYESDDYYMYWHDVEYFKDYVTVSEEHRFAYDSVYYNQSQDVHPFLYYALLHTVCSFFPGSFSNWYAIFINIVFSVLNIIVLYGIANYVFKEKRTTSLIVCMAYGFSAGCVSNAIYLRMYVMMTFFVLLFTFLHIKKYQQTDNKKYYLLIGITTVLGGLTHYYFYIYAFFISAFYCLFLLAKKCWKDMGKYVITMFGALAAAVVIYPSTLTHIFSGYRGTEAVENLVSGNIVEKVSTYIAYINLELLGGRIKYIVLFLALILCYVFLKECIKVRREKEVYTISCNLEGKIEIKEREYILLTLVCTTVMFFLIVSKISTISANRYIFPIYPLVVLILIWVVNGFVYKLRSNDKINMVILMLFCSVLLVSQYRGNYVDYLYTGYKAIQEDIAKISDKDVLYVSNYAHALYRDMVFLARSDRFIPIMYTDFENLLPQVKNQIQSEGILLYVNKEHDDNVVFMQLQEELQYYQYEFMGETYQSRIYYCY